MSIKVIAIGNRLMGDDGIAIYVAEKLRNRLKEKGIEVIIGETDFEYCLSKIEKDDKVIILDATYFGLLPGTVLEIVNNRHVERELLYKNIFLHENKFSHENLFSQHRYSLVKAIRDCYPSVDYYIIGIEGENYNFSLRLSDCIEKKFEQICDRSKEIITTLLNL